MINRAFKKVIIFILSFSCMMQPVSIHAASVSSSEYVSEVILSYGDTDKEAKKWLEDNGYQVVDQNLNDGADDLIYMSTKRSVYMGYKTTTDADEAITDMKLMNMKGDYAIQDYNLILEKEKSEIKAFIDNFVCVLEEYRTNYNNSNKRAIVAHDLLNMISDDDTGMNLGDLFLNKIKEEYTEEAYNNLSDEEKKKHADMTTMLMQGDSKLVKNIEQILATATDTSNTLWTKRYNDAVSYSQMLQDCKKENNLNTKNAKNKLTLLYDDTATSLVALGTSIKSWLKDYTDSKDELDNEEKLEDYLGKMTEDEAKMWLIKASQYQVLSETKLDGESLLDLFTSCDSSDFNKTKLYPLASILSEGQKATLDLIGPYYFLNMGINDSAAVSDVSNSFNLKNLENTVSLYEGINRDAIYDSIALTNEALQLQNSSGNQDYSSGWYKSISTKVIISVAAAFVSASASVASSAFKKVFEKQFENNKTLYNKYATLYNDVDFQERFVKSTNKNIQDLKKYGDLANKYEKSAGIGSTFSKVFKYAEYGFAVVSIVMSVYAIWSYYENLKDYYNVTFTQIPEWMVSESTQPNVTAFTYYKAVKCNRDPKFKTSKNKEMGDFGDVNGDVGKQWLALYTSTDAKAGNPILADFKTQVGDSSLPDGYSVLSMFGKTSAQNLTDEQNQYTYNDDLNGIYMFYKTEDPNTTASIFTTGTAALAAGCVIIVAGGVYIFKKKKKTKTV